MAGIWVISEQAATLLELVGAARSFANELKTNVTAVVTAQETATEAVACGADHAIVLNIPAGQPVESAAGVLAQKIAAADPDLVLVGATLRGKDLAARLAAKLNVSLSTDATGLKLEGGSLTLSRMVYGGGGVSTQAATTRPQMASVPPRTFPAPAHDPRVGEVTTLDVPADGRTQVVELRAKAHEGADITAANAVVGVGRGLAKQEDLALIEGLAAAMGGAVGCTRPVAEDAGWLPEDRYVGISGKKIAPQVYVAVGLSGQVQHVAGIRDAKVVVAINKDENAPIFNNADYGIVGDLYQVVPALTAELKKLLG